MFEPRKAIILVRGTQRSTLVTANTTAENRIISSLNASCLLHPETSVNLRGYASERDLLDFMLGKEVAMVYVSGVVDVDGKQTLIVDWLEKVDSASVPNAIAFMHNEISLAKQRRSADNKDDLEQLISPPSAKKARTIRAYPSDVATL